jgi:hypothetical protein
VFSCFNADVTIALMLKQARYPVYYLTCGGDPDYYSDHRNNSVEGSFMFSRIEKIPGFVTNSTPLFALESKSNNAQFVGEKYLKLARDNNMVFITWGDLNSQHFYANLQRQWGIDGVIADNIGDLTKKRGKKCSLFREKYKGDAEEEKKWLPLADHLTILGALKSANNSPAPRSLEHKSSAMASLAVPEMKLQMSGGSPKQTVSSFSSSSNASQNHHPNSSSSISSAVETVSSSAQQMQMQQQDDSDNEQGELNPLTPAPNNTNVVQEKKFRHATISEQRPSRGQTPRSTRLYPLSPPKQTIETLNSANHSLGSSTFVANNLHSQHRDEQSATEDSENNASDSEAPTNHHAANSASERKRSGKSSSSSSTSGGWETRSVALAVSAASVLVGVAGFFLGQKQARGSNSVPPR